MPELPEVESARRFLATHLGGATIQRVGLLDAAVVRPRPSTRASEGGPVWGVGLQRALEGRPFPTLHRHGKRLGWSAEGGAYLLWLGMSGRFVAAEAPPAHARLGLLAEDRTPVWYVDPRRFGGFAPCPAGGLDAALREGHGPDPTLDPFDAEVLAARLTGRRPIKVALLDQSVIAGLGNIHAVEVLFRARLHPAVPAGALRPEEHRALADAIRAQLDHAIAELGEAELALVTEGAPNPFQVYGKEGSACPRTGSPIARCVMAGRGTWWSPAWQTAGSDRALAFIEEND